MKAKVTLTVEFEDGQITGETRTIDYTPHSGNCSIEVGRIGDRLAQLVSHYAEGR